MANAVIYISSQPSLDLEFANEIVAALTRQLMKGGEVEEHLSARGKRLLLLRGEEALRTEVSTATRRGLDKKWELLEF